MSDFDEEAERERLREKYERDQEERADTQRMSELLLRGATMTNQHCDRCGDPIFRYEGQEFCPSCQAAEDRTAVQEADETSEGTSTDATRPAEEAVPSGADIRSESAERADAEPAAAAESAGAASAPADEEPSGPRTATPSEREGQPATDAATGADAPVRGDVGDARASLAGAIERLANRAAEADDPRRASEFLEAAEQAARTLRTLSG